MSTQRHYPSAVSRCAGAVVLLASIASAVTAQPVSGHPDGPLGNFKFRVEIEGIGPLTGFFSVDGLDWHTEVLTYLAGDSQEAKKLPGRTTYSNITLKRGYDGSDALWLWYKTVVDGNVQRKSGSVILMDEAGQEVRRYNFFEAWPFRYRIHDVNSMERKVLVEEIEIVVQKLELG